MPKRASQNARLSRSAARLAAVQALYQMELTGTDWRAVRKEFENHRLGAEIEGDLYHDADLALFRDILAGVMAEQVKIDQMTARALVDRWPLGRVDPTMRAVFRAAGHELTARPDIPPKVTIGEYVDVTKAFFEQGKESQFVNAVLDHMAREARPEALPPKGSPPAEGE
ncbi:MAG: transcription antitermination factor NusB [Pseudomonadota bacterium]